MCPEQNVAPTASPLLRPYQPDDLDAVVSLWYRVWHATFPDLTHPQTYAQWRSRFRDDLSRRGQVWVAEDSGRITGFIVVMVETGYLDQIFVETDQQRQGVGAALLNTAKQLCPTGLTLHTLQRNSQAAAFYAKHGFTAIRYGTNKLNGQPNVEYHWAP